MGYEDDVANIIYTLILAGVVIGFFAMVVRYVKEFMIDLTTSETAINEYEAADGELTTQAKQHTIHYTKKEPNKHDFDVDFNINLSNSTVKTEIVYAE
jgi:hypothetical protein